MRCQASISNPNCPAAMLTAPIERNDAPLEQIERNSVAIVRLPAAEKQAFRAATRDIYNRWSERIGSELVKKAETAVPQG